MVYIWCRNAAEWRTADGDQVLYGYIKDQPVWNSLRFWTAAYFDLLYQERASASRYFEFIIRIAAIITGRVTGFSRPSVCLFHTGLKLKRIKIKIGVNVPHDKSNERNSVRFIVQIQSWRSRLSDVRPSTTSRKWRTYLAETFTYGSHQTQYTGLYVHRRAAARLVLHGRMAACMSANDGTTS